MLTIDRQPRPPELPRFGREMETFLVAAAAGDAVRRPRRARVYVAVAAVAAVVMAVIAVIVGVAGSRGSGPNPGQNSPTGPAQLASFSVSRTAGGLVKLTLTPGQLSDPGALRAALARVGVPALVTANKVCYVPRPNSVLPQVLPVPHRHPQQGSMVWTIRPSALPRGDELSIGYFHVHGGFGIHVTIVPEHAALTCTPGPPAPPHR
jgi:hypothetical protein